LTITALLNTIGLEYLNFQVESTDDLSLLALIRQIFKLIFKLRLLGLQLRGNQREKASKSLGVSMILKKAHLQPKVDRRKEFLLLTPPLSQM
jgi:hypothetical protein